MLGNAIYTDFVTGSLILLSISLFNGAYSLVPQYLLPILFFSLGILLSEFTKNTAFTGAEKKIKIVLLFKAAVLIVIGLTSARTEALFTTCTVSFLAAVQVGTFNKLEGSAVATTMITGNLKSAMQCLHSFLFLKDKKAGKVFAQYIAVIVFFGIGAGTGAFLTRTFADNSIYFCLVFIAAAYGLLSLKIF